MLRTWIFSVVLAGTAALAGCGAPEGAETQVRQLEGSVLEAPGPATHEICADDVNVRNSSLAVIGSAKRGERATLMTERITGTGALAGNTFARVYLHAAPAGYGYVAQKFLCKIGSSPTPAPAGKRLIDVNYTTNRLKFFVDGKLVREWNVGTMRQAVLDSGAYKVGRFTITTKQVCPPWTKPGTTNTVTGCTAANPLGTRALWFSGYLYGLHGTNAPALIADGTTAAERRVSSGCIRNANANIEWLFDQVKVGDEVYLHW